MLYYSILCIVYTVHVSYIYMHINSVSYKYFMNIVHIPPFSTEIKAREVKRVPTKNAGLADTSAPVDSGSQ